MKKKLANALENFDLERRKISANNIKTSLDFAKEFQKSGGNCPSCGGEDSIIMEDSDHNFCLVYENCHCIKCKKQFSFKYELTEIINEDMEVSNG